MPSWLVLPLCGIMVAGMVVAVVKNDNNTPIEGGGWLSCGRSGGGG